MLFYTTKTLKRLTKLGSISFMFQYKIRAKRCYAFIFNPFKIYRVWLRKGTKLNGFIDLIIFLQTIMLTYYVFLTLQ